VSTEDHSAWRLLRYRHADGTSKDWAYRPLADGGMEICWGRTGQVRQHRRYPGRDHDAIRRRAAEKQAKGYVPLGTAVLRHGRFVESDSPRSASELKPNPAPEIHPGPLDLSRIVATGDDFWF
jgi:hypothetical protein